MPDEKNDANQTNPNGRPPTYTGTTPADQQPPAPGRTPVRDEAQKLKDAPVPDPPPPTTLKPR